MPKRDRDAVNSGLNQAFGLGGGDLLASVIQSDRRRAGRDAGDTNPSPAEAEAPPPPLPSTDKQVISHYDNKTDTQCDNTASHTSIRQADTSSDKSEDQLATAAPRREPRRKPARAEKSELLEERLREARRMARSVTTTVTLRLPREMNDWLDEYVHRSWPERVRKQELVIEALQMLFARRGRPGELLLETELLPKPEP